MLIIYFYAPCIKVSYVYIFYGTITVTELGIDEFDVGLEPMPLQ